MMRNKQANRWRHKVGKGRAATKVVVAVMVERKETRLVRVIHPGTQVKVRINSARRATAMTMQCKFKVVARRATAMTMVTRLWREPGTRRITLEWQIGWGLVLWTRMISV